MQKLPAISLAAENAGDAQRKRRESVTVSHFGLVPLDFDEVCETVSDAFRKRLEANRAAASVIHRGKFGRQLNLIRTAGDWTGWVRQCDVVAPREEGDRWLGVAGS
jgi:hypothetical protein